MIERLDAFMARANAAYYATRDPFRDFTTSPEISQVFGELLGLWAAVCWRAMGMPTPVLLIEAGPGRGTLMEDALRATAQAAPDFRAASQLHLIETSPRLRAIQAARLPAAIWHDGIETVPDGPFLLLANEFLDALPIRQFVRRRDGWCERYVGDHGSVERPAAPGDIDAAWHNDPENSVRELCPAAGDVVQAIAERCRSHPGVALLIDYGPEHDAPGDSLQAIAEGKAVDPLTTTPGTADLTAHVGFSRLATTARAAGMLVHGPVPQGIFLARLGLFQRSNRLARSLPPAKAAAIMQAARRLGEPDRMGRLFKAMALSHPALAHCPGFED
ncbi:MAG: SAM-dependent methyltransferase [Acetobacteraceae bacterium]|nr:SAM-dependent methyltransferase [Acetobacteraceae bacterium]